MKSICILGSSNAECWCGSLESRRSPTGTPIATPESARLLLNGRVRLLLWSDRNSRQSGPFAERDEGRHGGLRNHLREAALLAFARHVAHEVRICTRAVRQHLLHGDAASAGAGTFSNLMAPDGKKKNSFLQWLLLYSVSYYTLTALNIFWIIWLVKDIVTRAK